MYRNSKLNFREKPIQKQTKIKLVFYKNKYRWEKPKNISHRNLTWTTVLYKFYTLKTYT